MMRQALRALVSASVLSAGLLLTATLPLHAAQKAARPAGHPPGVAIASAHALATDAGMEMIRAGGNAFDAAVAVSATLAVVEPISSGIGGGGFFLLHDARSGKDVFVDARETAVAAVVVSRSITSTPLTVPTNSLYSSIESATLKRLPEATGIRSIT